MRTSYRSTRTDRSSSLKKVSLARRILFPAVLLVMILILSRLPELTNSSQKTGNFRYLKADIPQPEQQNFDVHYYKLKLDFSFDPDTSAGFISGETEIRFSSKVSKLRRILLDFNSTMQVDSVAGLAFAFKQEGPNLRLDFGRQLDEGSEGRVIIFYSGWPEPYHPWISGLGISRHPESEGSTPWVSTMNPPFGASTWFPSKDDPSDKADSARFEITIPEDLTAVCNGIRIKDMTLPNGRRRIIYNETYPIATYLMAVNIGKFYRYEYSYKGLRRTFPIEFFVFPEDSEFTEEISRQLRSMLKYYEKIAGPYPFDREKYAMVRSNASGGMENQTITSVEEFNPKRERLYAHELAHQWAGDDVTNVSFGQSFLNEGLATYMTALYIEHSKGEKVFKEYMESIKPLKKGPVLVREILKPDSVYDTQRVYYKGAWFFHMLRKVVGDSVFFRGFRQFFLENAYGNSSTEKLQKVFERVSSRSLTDFFQSWLQNEALPEVSVQLQRAEPDNSARPYRYELELKQGQSGKPYYYRLPVRFIFRSPARRDTLIWIEFKRKQLRVPLTFSAIVDSMRVDANNDFLLNE